MRRHAVLLALATVAASAVACGGSSDRERAGDEAYAVGRYAEAASRYNAALGGGSNGRLLAKLAAAQAHAGRGREAVDAYLKLAGEDPSRADEAADGIDALARGADRTGDVVTLRAAVSALQAVAADRPYGRYALTLLQRGGAADADLTTLLPAAMAAAPDAGTMDSLLAAYGDMLGGAGNCDQAVLAYRAVLRRNHAAAPRGAATTGLAECAVDLGDAALAGHDPTTALGWFAEAAQYDSTSVAGRRALLGTGRARAAQGDTVAAALAWQAALTHSEKNDSVRRAAAAALKALGQTANTGDSARTGTP